MFVKKIDTREAANLLYWSDKNDWRYDVCLALAEHLDKESSETPLVFDANLLSQSFTLYQNLKEFNKVNHTTLKDIDLAYSLTTIIPLSDGRFLAENF